MRRLYDSVDEFDDHIPDALSPKQRNKFISVFGPVFERNAKFIVERPIPLLGDMNTPYKQVVKFYEFWSKCEFQILQIIYTHIRMLSFLSTP